MFINNEKYFLLSNLVDCKWGNKICNICNVTCGGGKKMCSRSKDVEARNGGKDCEGDEMSIEDCNNNIPCPGI